MVTDTKLNDIDVEADATEILHVPARKRKNYAMLAFGKKFDPELNQQIENFFKKNYAHLSVVRPKNADSVRRLFNRQISLTVIDDSFSSIEENANLVKELKQKKADEAVPILFLTENPSELIRHYNEKLIAYQEVDNFLSYQGIAESKITEGIRYALDPTVARRSRRYNVDIPVVFFSINGDTHEGKLVDMSLHGTVLESKGNYLFRDAEQFKIRIPIGKLLPPKHGEFLRIPAKVRRLFMGGNRAALSWEYLNSSQLDLLTTFLTRYVNLHLKK